MKRNSALLAWIQKNHQQARGTRGHREPFATCPYPTCRDMRSDPLWPFSPRATIVLFLAALILLIRAIYRLP